VGVGLDRGVGVGGGSGVGEDVGGGSGVGLGVGLAVGLGVGLCMPMVVGDELGRALGVEVPNPDATAVAAGVIAAGVSLAAGVSEAADGDVVTAALVDEGVADWLARGGPETLGPLEPEDAHTAQATGAPIRSASATASAPSRARLASRKRSEVPRRGSGSARSGKSGFDGGPEPEAVGGRRASSPRRGGGSESVIASHDLAPRWEGAHRPGHRHTNFG
jgi:hypothetical protein